MASSLFLLVVLAHQAYAQETPLVVAFDDTDYRVIEGESLTVTVTLTPAADREVLVPFDATPLSQTGVPADRSDYSVNTHDVTFDIGEAEKTFIFTAHQDSDLSIDDVKLVFASLPSGVTAAPSGTHLYDAMVRMLDDDYILMVDVREDHPLDQRFTHLGPPHSPEGYPLVHWISGPDARYFRVERYVHTTHDLGFYYVRTDTVLDRAEKDMYEFFFHYSDGHEPTGPDPGCSEATPTNCRADYRGTIAVNVTDKPEIALDPTSMFENKDMDIDVSLLGFQNGDTVTFTVGTRCGTGGLLDGVLSLTTAPTATVAADGTATTTLSVAAGSVSADTDCEVIATGTTETRGTLDADAATLRLVDTLPPGPPRNLTATPGDENSGLAWEVPSSDGGSPILRYEYALDNESVWTDVGDVLSTTVDSLTDGQSYHFQVRAVNAVGAGPAASTRIDPPGSPRNFSATPGDGNVELTWEAPLSDGGFEIIHYEYRADASEANNLVDVGNRELRAEVATVKRLTDSVEWTEVGKELRTTAPLTNGQSYDFEVRAVNAVGPGPAAATEIDLPGPPRNLAATPGDGSVELEWLAPSSDGGLQIIRYEYQVDGSGVWTEVGLDLSTTVASLTNGQSYDFEVRAVNAVSPGPAASAQATPVKTPGPPQNLTATPGDGSVELAWEAPSTDGGSPIIRYEYRVDGGDGWTEVGTELDTTVGSLTNGQSYDFEVRAVNAVGPGSVARTQATLRVVDIDNVPGPPRNLTATPGDGSVELAWEAPSSDGGSPINRYEYRVDGSGGWTEVGTELRTTVGSLTNGQSYDFEVRAVNAVGAGPAARTQATPTRANRPPAFRSARYVFELEEGRDGRSSPVALGRVEARDPQGDSVRYELTSGNRERFAVDARSGAFNYIGPGENYETGPRRYEFRVRAVDGAGAAATASVEVRVIEVNEPPALADDEVETLEDTPVTIAVLENDHDPDGDRLSVSALSAPAHGTAALTTGGEVVYTPEADYHGPDRFIYTVDDNRGLTASAAVHVTVLPANDPPEAVGTIPDQYLDVRDPPVTIDLTPYFRDRDGDPLTYTVSVSEPVATVTVSVVTLTLNGVSPGAASVTVTAHDPGGLTATQTFTAFVSDQRARGVLEDTLAAMGRGHLASARSTLGRRVDSAGRERMRITLAGYRVPWGAGAAAAAGRATAEQWLPGMPAGMSEFPEGPSAMALGAGRGSRGPAVAGMPAPGGLGSSLPGTSGGGSPPGISAVAPPGFGSSLFSAFGGAGRTEWLLPFGGGQDEADGAGTGRRWTVWGQGDVQTFQGARSAAERYHGDVRTAYVGVDTRLRGRWLAGLAVARSSAAGEWRYGPADGLLTTTMRSVHPYLRWSDGETTVWTTVGGGSGGAENERRLYGLHEDSTLGLRLGLVEVQRGLAPVGGGVLLQLRGDASWARLATAAGDELVDALRVDVHQARVGMEASRSVRTGGGTLLEPFGEVHARRDGGSGQTGAGLELAGGMRVMRGAVRIEGLGRLLALHSAAGYRERGAALTVSVGEGAQRPGLTLSLAPRWGAQATARDALWQEEVYGMGHRAGRDERAIDARVGYGFRWPSGGLLTPFGLYGRSQYGRRLQAGVVVAAVGKARGPSLGLQVSGESYSRTGRVVASHRVSVLGRIAFGGVHRATASDGSRATSTRALPAVRTPSVSGRILSPAPGSPETQLGLPEVP